MEWLSLLLLVLSTTVCSCLQFLSHPLDNVISPQNSAFLYCNVTGLSVPTISWFKVNSGQLSNGSDYILYENGTLEIINFNSNKNGQYYCVASTSFGSVRSLDAHLQVAVLYSTSINEKSLPVEENEPLELTCTIPQSLPSANVTWYRGNDKVISDNRIAVTLSHKLVFSYTKSSDQAPYECQVKNDFVDEERIPNRYIVSISGNNPNPTISWIEDAVPFSQTVVAGKQAQLECFATGRSLPSYTWSKDGFTITGTERIIFTQNNRILTLNNVTLSDAGTYMCTASQGTTKLSKTANLTVLDPPIIFKAFNTVTQFASLSVNVSCTAQGTPPLYWIWRNNTVPLQQSSNIKFTETGFQSTLTIDSLDIHDSGIIQCIVYNDNGYSAANNNLIVQTMAPSFTKEPHDLLVLTGDTILLPCTANSYPFPSFSWLRNDQALITNINRHVQSSENFNGTLLISSAIKSDSGNYKCVADTTIHYAISDPALVKVIDYPQLLSQSNDTIVIEGHNVSLKCSISTITDIKHTYLWRKDSQPLNIISPKLLLTDNGLVIHDFQNSDAGLYSCLVKLQATGSVAVPVIVNLYSAFLTTVPPKVPSPPHTIAKGYIKHNSTFISWSNPMDNGGLSVLNYIVQVLPVPDCSFSILPGFNLSVSVNEATIDSLMPFTKYTISLYANNSKGLSTSSEPIQLQTDQAAPSSPPGFIVVEQTEELHQLNVSWAPLLCNQSNGIIVNYTVTYWVQSSPNLLFTLTSSNNATNIILTRLQLLVYYKIQVAANTYVGRGPFSHPVISKTSRANPPNPPSKFLGQIFNCSSVMLSWSPPEPRQSEPVNNLTIVSSYILTHLALSTTYNISFNTFYIVTELNEDSMYTFNVSATNAFGTSQAISLNVTLPPCSTQTTTNTTVSSKVHFYAQDWFVYSAAGIAGALIVVILCVVLCICCCVWRKKEENKSSAPSPNKFHFTYPNRRSTVLDRMMQVETMSPANDTKEAEYAELNTIQAVLASENDSIGTGTLTSQSSSLLKSKYQYRSPMEQEVYQSQNEALDQRQAWNNKQKRKGDSSSRKDKGSVSLNRLKQTNQPTNMYAFSSQRSTSPTDTVSSFEYESQSHVLHEMMRNGFRPHGNNLVRGSHQDEQETQVDKNTSSGSSDIRPVRIPSFKRSQLPDLALMTALPSNNTSQTSSPLPLSPSPDNSLHSLSTHRYNPRKAYPYNSNDTKNRDVPVQRLQHFPPSQFKSHGSHVTRPPFLPLQSTTSTVL